MKKDDLKESITEQDIKDRKLNSEYKKNYISNEKISNIKNIEKNISNVNSGYNNGTLTSINGNAGMRISKGPYIRELYKAQIGQADSRRTDNVINSRDTGVRNRYEEKHTEKNDRVYDSNKLVKRESINNDIGKNVKEQNKHIRNNIEIDRSKNLNDKYEKELYKNESSFSSSNTGNNRIIRDTSIRIEPRSVDIGKSVRETNSQIKNDIEINRGKNLNNRYDKEIHRKDEGSFFYNNNSEQNNHYSKGNESKNNDISKNVREQNKELKKGVEINREKSLIVRGEKRLSEKNENFFHDRSKSQINTKIRDKSEKDEKPSKSKLNSSNDISKNVREQNKELKKSVEINREKSLIVRGEKRLSEKNENLFHDRSKSQINTKIRDKSEKDEKPSKSKLNSSNDISKNVKEQNKELKKSVEINREKNLIVRGEKKLREKNENFFQNKGNSKINTKVKDKLEKDEKSIKSKLNSSNNISKNVKEHSNEIKNNVEIDREKNLSVRDIDIEEYLNDDQTDNLTLRAANKSLLKAKKIVRTGKATIRMIKGSKQIGKEIKLIYKGNDLKKIKPIIKRIGKKGTIASLKKIAIRSSNNALESLKNEDSTENLASQTFYDSGRNIRTTYNNAKRVVNVKRKIKKVTRTINEYKKQKNIKNISKNSINSLKKPTKISQKKEKVELAVKEIKTAQNNLKKNVLNKVLKKDKKRKYFQKILENQYKNALKKLDEFKKLLSALLRNPKAIGIIAGAFGVFMLISITCSAISGLSAEMATTIPNIDNAETWIEKMNKIDTSTSREINAADEFVVKNKEVKANWKDVIAVYMAKYYNDPPSLNDSSGTGGGITIGGSNETTFTGSYSDLIKAASEKYGVDSNLIAGVIKQESNFDTNCISEAGAMGLMQLMPGTAAQYGVDNAFDPYQNIMGGTQLLQELCEYYNNDLAMVLIAYNLGQGNMERLGINSDSDLYKAPAETQAYVPIVMGNYEAYKNGTALPDDAVIGVINGPGENSELAKIYNLFNKISKSTRTVSHTKHHSDGSSSTSHKTITTVTLTKNDINYVMNELKFDDDQIELAKSMLEADLFSDVIPNFDFKFKIPGASSSSGSGAVIGSGGSKGTGTALSDEDFAKVKSYIDQCIGIPYQLGGSDPASGVLDCSGFVSWVYKQTGVLDGRYTAQGLCDISTPVSEGDLKPGDLIFFQDTYDCGDTVTHVGIYVGDGMMAHSGNPCQYASYTTSYWQQHFYGYGRLT